MIFRLGQELHGLRPTAGLAGELATVPVGRIFLPRELSRAPYAAQQPRLDAIEPALDHEFANRRSMTALDQADPTAFELVRTCFTAPDEAQLTRVVTTLSARPDDSPDLMEVNTFTDPFANPIISPTGQTELTVRWYLIWDTDRTAYSEAPLLTCPESQIPRGVGIPNFPESWADFRFAWQSRYSTERRTTHLVEGFGRLFVVLRSFPGIWHVRAGGLLGLSLSRKRPRRDMPGVAVK